MNMYVLQRDREERWIAVLLYTLFHCLFQSKQNQAAQNDGRKKKRLQERSWEMSSLLCSIIHHTLHLSFLLFTCALPPCGTCLFLLFLSSAHIYLSRDNKLMWWNQTRTSDGSRGEDVRVSEISLTKKEKDKWLPHVHNKPVALPFPFNGS